MLFPFAWYLYGAVYADAFCLAVMLAAFLALERDRLWFAGFFGFVASASRPIGLIFAVALVLLLIERRNSARIAQLSAVPSEAARVIDGLVESHRTGWCKPSAASVRRAFRRPRGRGCPSVRAGRRRSLLAAKSHVGRQPGFLAFGGFIAWCGYLWVDFGDPLLWEHIQSVPGWDQGSGPTTWFKVFLLDQLSHDASSPFTWSKLAQGLLAIGLLFTLPRIARRFGWAYAAFTAGVLLLPIIGTKDFMGTGRYLLVAFPMFALGGEWLADRARLRVRGPRGVGPVVGLPHHAVRAGPLPGLSAPLTTANLVQIPSPWRRNPYQVGWGRAADRAAYAKPPE